jgi:subtilisin-like proprotein convertase family protein
MKKLFIFSVLFLIVTMNVSHAQYYFNRAFSFTGVTGSYAATDPGSELNITSSFTLECWVKQAVTSGAQIVIQKRLGTGATGYTMYLSTGRVAIRTNSSTRLTGTTTIPADVWTHIAATYNSSTNVFTVYVNGVADGTNTVSGAAPSADTDSLRFANGFNSPFNGLMDEIRVWNVERTAAEIQSAMRIPLGEGSGVYTGLVGCWRGNNVTGGSGIDEINGNTAHLNGTASFVNLSNLPGGYMAFNTGVSFSGATGSYVTSPNASALNITGSFTLECWVNPTNVSSPSYQILIQKRLGSSSVGYTMYLNLGKVSIRTNSSTRLTGTTVIPNDKWSHVAATYNSSTNVFTVYVNGVADGTATVSGAAPSADTDSLRLGAGFNSPYAGLMDEVRIADYTKTQEEIQKGMYVSYDQNNEPSPTSNTNIAYSFEGTLQGTDGSSRGAFAGTGVHFTRVYENSSEFPSPLDRWDAGHFGDGFRFNYSNLDFGASPTTVRDSIYMPEGLTINDINVFAAITHTYANDISISLVNPAGTTTRILYPGASPDLGYHMMTIFDDQADSTIGGTLRAPWSPRVKPINTLSVFNSQNSLGWWKIVITDIYPSADNGTLIGWGIQFNNQVITGIKDPNITGVPYRFMLYQNYPNPFNPTTNIKYDLAKDIIVKITVYDLLGREVGVPVNEFKKAGSYSLNFDGTRLASGVYFYKIEAGQFIETKKMILIK